MIVMDVMNHFNGYRLITMYNRIKRAHHATEYDRFLNNRSEEESARLAEVVFAETEDAWVDFYSEEVRTFSHFVLDVCHAYSLELDKRLLAM